MSQPMMQPRPAPVPATSSAFVKDASTYHHNITPVVPAAVPAPPPAPSPATVNQSPPTPHPARWIPPGGQINIRGFQIDNGLIYVGKNLPVVGGYGNDACLIDPSLTVAVGPRALNEDGLDYWPHYASISPKTRGAYLQWLADGRCEPSTDIGFIFLFFYSLERRLLVDGNSSGISEEERGIIHREILRLVETYGHNQSFRRYALDLLAVSWTMFQYGPELPEYITAENGNLLAPIRLRLALQVSKGKPIPWETAFQWIRLRPDFNFRTPARRCPREFQELFRIRYHRKFGAGLIVKPNKTPFAIEYRAASPSLVAPLRLDVEMLSDPFNLSQPFKKLASIAEECSSALDSYSRYLGRKDANPTSLSALTLLPEDLLTDQPLAKLAAGILLDACTEGPNLLSLADFCHKIGETAPTEFGRKDLERMATLFDQLEIGMAPDPRYHNIKAGKDGTIAIFRNGHGTGFKPSSEFLALNTILILGASVSAADDQNSAAEELVLQNLINDNLKLNQSEKDSLSAVLHWCLRTPQGTAGMKQRIAALGAADRTVIGKVMVSVANADGHIDAKEIKLLEKIYAALGLPGGQVTTDIHGLMAATEPVTVRHRDPSITYPIPRPPEETKVSQSFFLDHEVIKKREEETRQVSRILEGIFDDPADQEVEAKVPPERILSGEGMLDSLDSLHRSLFSRLIVQEAWERETLEGLCREIGLMPDGAIEGLNEWAFVNASANLIEDGEPIYVDLELAKELMNV
jgi:tellurite resistance protein